MTRPTLMLVLAAAAGLATALYAPALASGDPSAALEAHAVDAAVAAPVPVAPPAAHEPSDPIAWATSVYEAVRGGHWAIVAGLVLIAVTWVFRRFILSDWAWVRTDRGGVLLAGLLSIVGAFTNASLAGQWMDGKAWLAALEAALVAMGGYVGVRRLIWPADADAKPPHEELLESQPS